MSRKLTRLSLSTLGVLTIMSFLLAGFSILRRNLQTHASTPSEAKSIEQRLFLAKAMGKPNAGVRVQIEAVDEIPLKDSVSIKLKGFIQANRAKVYEYRWELPEGVSLVSGTLNGIFNSSSAVNASGWFETEITVIGFSKMNKQNIFLHGVQIESDHTGSTYQSIVNNALISSRPEASLEYVAPIMMATKNEERVAAGKPEARYTK